MVRRRRVAALLTFAITHDIPYSTTVSRYQILNQTDERPLALCLLPVAMAVRLWSTRSR